MKNLSKLTPLLVLSTLVNQRNPSFEKADITNAPHLMGDASSDDDYGDITDEMRLSSYGDPYGDPDGIIDTYDTVVGDPYGDPKKKRSFVRRALPYAIGAAGVGAITAALIHKRKKKAALQRQTEANASRSTITNSIYARQHMGRIPRDTVFPFYSVQGATLNGYPLAPTEGFAADTFKYNLDRQSTDTPFEVEIVPGVFAVATWTVTSVGVVAARYYTTVFLVVGLNAFTGAPGTIFTVTGTMPLIGGGSLVIAANPFSFTIAPGFYAKIAISPWVLVSNKPVLALGSYSAGSPITFSITGLPSSAAVSMVIPGSLHQWTIAMRNRLL